jgi:multidrug efflux pump subunit AcrA (membrane-fusion protein)
MNRLNVGILGSALALALLSCANYHAGAPTRMVAGTMHVTDASSRHFRVGATDQVLVAPANAPLQALDGRYVQVEVEANGRVERISDLGPSSE